MSKNKSAQILMSGSVHQNHSFTSRTFRSCFDIVPPFTISDLPAGSWKKYGPITPLTHISHHTLALGEYNGFYLFIQFFTFSMAFKWIKIVQMDTSSSSLSSHTVVCRFDSTNVLNLSFSMEGFRPQPSSSSRPKSPLRNNNHFIK